MGSPHRQSHKIHSGLHGTGTPATRHPKAEATLCMKLMLDTDICIYLIKQHPPSVLERFLSHPVGDIGISSITVAELEYGVSKSRRTTKNRAALAQFLSPLEVASFDRDAAAV